MLTVRFAPEPPTTMPELGTSVVSELPAVTVSAEAAVSTSPTVNDRSPVELSALMFWSAIALMVGEPVAVTEAAAVIEIAARKM